MKRCTETTITRETEISSALNLEFERTRTMLYCLFNSKLSTASIWLIRPSSTTLSTLGISRKLPAAYRDPVAEYKKSKPKRETSSSEGWGGGEEKGGGGGGAKGGSPYYIFSQKIKTKCHERSGLA
jgi:hypothetical protein